MYQQLLKLIINIFIFVYEVKFALSSFFRFELIPCRMYLDKAIIYIHQMIRYKQPMLFKDSTVSYYN